MNNGSLWTLHSFQQMYLTMLDNVLLSAFECKLCTCTTSEVRI